MLDQILDNDQEIKNDANNQYPNEIHGILHTRRVAFLLSVLADRVGLDEYKKRILFHVDKNHDIGREDDEEESWHGAKSVKKMRMLGKDRLSEFTDVDRAVIETIITQHSMSQRNNEVFIRSLERNNNSPMLKQFTSEEIDYMLKLFKDADKYDRVRLSPLGTNLREGLDPSRLFFKEHAEELECLAYECYGFVSNDEQGRRLTNVLDYEHIRRDFNRFFEIFKAKEDIMALSNKFDQRMENIDAVGNDSIPR